jgi:hypothetical protein
MIKIFKVGDVEYPENLNKPVRYDVDFLKSIASSTSSAQITREHSDEVIGALSNFVVEDGYLLCEEPEGLELKGMGFSPVFDFDLYEYEDYFRPVNGKMINIGFTKTPRSQIVYNSVSEGEDKMDDTLRKVLQEKEDLIKKMGVLEKEKDSYLKMLDTKDAEIEKIKASYSDVDSKLQEVDALKEKAELYDTLQASRKEELVNELAKGNDKLAEKYATFDYEQLMFLKENNVPENTGNGIPATGAMDLDRNGSNPSTHEDDDSYSDDEFKADYIALYGVEP